MGRIRPIEFHADRAVIREFDGVAHQVDQDLQQPLRIAVQRTRQRGRNVRHHVQFLRRGDRHRRRQQIVQQLLRRKCDILQLQFARFQPGAIEQIADQIDQALRVRNQARPPDWSGARSTGRRSALAEFRRTR